VRPTLLLADDSVTIQRVIELTFADEDVDVVTASDGDEAIALINGQPPDIVLVDVGMPGRNGYDVARYVKRSPMLSHIPVVLLVGAFEAIDQRRAEEAGCDGVLAKPFEPKLVIGKVRELLGRNSRARTAAIRQLNAPTGGDTRHADERTAAASQGGQASQASQAGPAGSAPGARVDEYFDRLDQAFSQLSGTAPGRARPARDQSPAVPAESAATHGNERLGAHALQAAREAWEAVSARDRAEGERGGQAPSGLISLPSLPEAFAALLSAERTAGRPQFAPHWPTPAGPGQAAQTDVSEDVIAKAAQRVVEQISTQGVRETVGEIVSSVAERLIREEIARLKSSVS
jgi:CheY-like chemotaxis protein